ncbi:MAG: pyridoxal phosphate-dependent decarboxylase family protein [Chitinophagales bacterium]
MQTKDWIRTSESLDPENWEQLRCLGRRMVDEMMDYLQSVKERPVWQKPSSYAIKSMQQPLPEWPSDTESVYDDFLTQVLPFNTNNIHPRFWSWVEGGGTPFGMLSDMLASGMNANLAIGNHMPMYVERQVLDWSKEMFGFPSIASGLLTSGASMANLTALLVARNHFNKTIRKEGLQSLNSPLTIYASSETHSCVSKAVEIIGVGSEQFRKVPVDDQWRIRTDLLREMIADDRKNGYAPFCIIGNAGTVNTGAIDDLDELGTIAREEKLWFHIDGAFGAVPRILPEYYEQLKGIDFADSLSFDFHKWFYMNYEVGCVLIRDAAAHKQAFSTEVNYLLHHERGLSAGPEPFSNYGMELSRGFKALKVWMLLKENGIRKYARLIRQNIGQAKYLEELVGAEPKLEMMADVPMNIVCYRYNPGIADLEKLNGVNKEILMRLHEEGVAAPSYTVLKGNYALRVAITNHRSTTRDFDELIEGTIRIGDELMR